MLLKVGLNFVSPDICNDTFGPMIGGRKLRVGVTPDTMLCVGDLNGGKDTCLVRRTHVTSLLQPLFHCCQHS
jgi:hypothetical protein